MRGLAPALREPTVTDSAAMPRKMSAIVRIVIGTGGNSSWTRRFGKRTAQAARIPKSEPEAPTSGASGCITVSPKAVPSTAAMNAPDTPQSR